jgi:hypothetical protein
MAVDVRTPLTGVPLVVGGNELLVVDSTDALEIVLASDVVVRTLPLGGKVIGGPPGKQEVKPEN